MSPAMTLASDTSIRTDPLEKRYQKGVKHLCENGVSKVPSKYILPLSERPNVPDAKLDTNVPNIKLPIIDLAELLGPNRSQVLESLTNACRDYGFFQVINHGIAIDVIRDTIDVAQRFFELSFEEREKYMSADINAPARYGTSLNQTNDSVFCWRDFLKLKCHPLLDVLAHWPSSPSDLRETIVSYSREAKSLYLILMKVILETLGLTGNNEDSDKDEILNDFEDGSQIMAINYYPSCPEPDLTLGMPPHSDYGFLTLLLQDDVKGLQIQHEEKWVTVEPIPNSFVVNIGDHFEIFSNGRYKSVLHRVIVNSSKSRISVVSLHSLPFECMVTPSAKLIDEANPKRYKDTDFASFIEYISSCGLKQKNFLESRKLT
ncbi:hypothetical protein GIB67_018093 [Kingdonia uniflora]|uniref:Fe2OG dioxygenase domain-containing protein n=1 Tax=Kingdonia uniflora TaxID=39325 RepID=A0A7J7NWN1_9MAGN|nr:hypothetical protein GIB67_018093 [Kingdonia uniflora]